MKLILLGTGGYFPTSRRHTACLMLPEVGVVLDAGSGMCRIGRHLQTEQLDIFLSHAHLDHISGLTYLVNLVPANVLARTTVHGRRREVGCSPRTFVCRADLSGCSAVSLRATCGVVCVTGRRQAHALSTFTSGRLAGLSTGLARSFDGVRNGHDGRRAAPTMSKTFAASICWCTKHTLRTN